MLALGSVPSSTGPFAGAGVPALGLHGPEPGSLVRVVRGGGCALPWQAVDVRTREIVAWSVDEQLLRAECHDHGWIPLDAVDL